MTTTAVRSATDRGLRLPRGVSTAINWGNSSIPRDRPFPSTVRVLNKPEAVAVAIDKLAALTKWAADGIASPKWWTVAADVPRDDSSIVLCRTNLRGSCGDGIVVVRPGEDLVPAPLYVQYVRKTAEYRFHVVNGKVIFTQQKKKRNDEQIEGDRALIRSHDNGWIFASVGVSFQDEAQRAAAESLAVASVASLGLDFGACDLIISKRDGKPYVLEVNTAPGLSSPTLIQAYKRAFTEEYSS